MLIDDGLAIIIKNIERVVKEDWLEDVCVCNLQVWRVFQHASAAISDHSYAAGIYRLLRVIRLWKNAWCV